VTNKERERILAEIDELAAKPRRKPGDVSISELRDRWGVQDQTVKSWMRPHVEDGTFISLLVYDPAIGRECRVYRKRNGSERGAGGGA